jgi:signal transduction histidine kinase
LLLFFALIAFHAQANPQNAAIVLKGPVAFCVSTLDHCQTSNQKTITQQPGYDARELNNGSNDPLTLVFEIPPEIAGQTGIELLTQAQHRNHCFQFDNDRSATACSNRQLTWIPVPTTAKFIYSQNVQGDDPRLVTPQLAVGTTHALKNLVQKDRDPIIGLAGWYAFLTLAALLQMISRRNRLASLCLAIIGLCMFCRTTILSNYSFAGLSLFGSTIDRRIEFIAIPILAISALTFYGSFIGKRLLKIRYFMLGLAALSAAYILLAQQPHDVLLGLNVAMFLSLLMLVLGAVLVTIATRILQLRERLVMLVGIFVMGTGLTIDATMSFLSIPFIASIGLLPYCFAFDTVCQFMLVALRNDAAHVEARQLQEKEIATQAQLVKSQEQLVETLKNNEIILEEKVKQRTAELESANSQILSAYNTADALRIKAETAQQQTAQALDELKATQTQLIAAEKMASLGLLVSNVAHEINTPIGAVKSSGALIADTLESTLAEMPKLFSLLEEAPRGLFIQLVLGNKGSTQPMNTREERALTKQIAAQLEEAGVIDANRKARLLMKLRAHQNPLHYLPLLQHPESDFILQVASNIADVVNSTHNINHAVERVSRVVYALKALSGDDVLRAVILAPLQPDMDKALAKYASQMQNVELVQDYQPEMAPIHADHDAMEQLCIHLVMNALQAMNYEGKLSVVLKAENNQAIISVTDTGSGIADDIKGRIFEPFFTTRTSGEGSGMGLAIVRRIVEQHQGTIQVQTEVGVGTTIAVTLHYQFAG